MVFYRSFFKYITENIRIRNKMLASLFFRWYCMYIKYKKYI
ncbi:hypothetical protein HMPREF2111_01028 [Staphylococcus aureus 917]|nr:hypothetical protein HMPREF9529_00288 [Staphylococcus aureus subsp. aureus MRSA177]KAJ48105.1 hypothetical protein HMPREF1625_00539 [Staphylococcus aureus 880]KIE15785.1 hypothetical protein HMPREF2111_01028 [Staphylococcus aureus 917]